MAITNILRADDVSIEISRDMQTFSDVIATKISDNFEQEITKRLADEIINVVFEGASKYEVAALMHVLLNDPDIRSKMVAYRAKQRMGIDT